MSIASSLQKTGRTKPATPEAAKTRVRLLGPEIRNPLGDFSEQTGAMFG